MWWRLTRAEFQRRKGAANKRAFKAIVRSGRVPGLLAYRDGEPVGWCAVEPRAAYPVLERSRTLKPIDAQPAWAITCFFVARGARRQGLSVALLRAAVRYVARQGGRIVEGYPVEARAGQMPDAFAFTGLVGAFRAAGFVEAARPSATRAIMRHAIR